MRLSISTPVYVSPKPCLALCPLFSWRDRGPLAPLLRVGGDSGVLELVPRVLIVGLGMAKRLSLSTLPALYVSGGIIERKFFGESNGSPSLPPRPQPPPQTYRMGGLRPEGGGLGESEDG